ncbi:MAG TPA: Uma2 family endonuclease [Gammaproteobacteria bacterium]|nr:Uma2 family endonuclease [Gammaproteobacteria bacterium]
MSASNSAVRFTYSDYKNLTSSTDDRYELLDGELYKLPAPTTRHQFIAQNLEFLLVQHVRATDCGYVLHAPLDVVLGGGSERSVVQPDIIFIAKERASIITDQEVIGAPDLVVEILSPGTAKRDRGAKKALYERSGVREYWAVDPALESVEALRLGPAGYSEAERYGPRDRLASAVVAGFEAPLSEILRSPH